MDITESTQMTYNQNKVLYDQNFSLGTNTTQSFAEKMELITLVCYLTQQFKAHDMPVKNSFDALNMICKSSTENFGIPLCVLCDDLLYQVKPIANPGYKTTSELIARIKTLLEQWLPF